jgi:NAD(P)-dependent dehydrogenase (short-subunit alcohol dehydrogenase family)
MRNLLEEPSVAQRLDGYGRLTGSLRFPLIEIYTGGTPRATLRCASVRGRAQLPENLVGAVMFLASQASDFMTGQTINVDGGKMMH